MDYQGLVKEFHVRQRQPVGANGPLATRVPSDERQLREELIFEETAELFKALNADNRVLIADGLADLLVVVFGTAVVYDMPMDRIFAEVHRSNMTKDAPTIRAPGEKYGAGAGKGAGYMPPRLLDLLSREHRRLTPRSAPGLRRRTAARL